MNVLLFFECLSYMGGKKFFSNMTDNGNINYTRKNFSENDIWKRT